LQDPVGGKQESGGPIVARYSTADIVDKLSPATSRAFLFRTGCCRLRNLAAQRHRIVTSAANSGPNIHRLVTIAKAAIVFRSALIAS
jgi:hypothetical protein